MTAETATRAVWREWGRYARFGFCAECGGHLYVRAARGRGPYLCIDCFDLTPVAAKLAARRRV